MCKTLKIITVLLMMTASSLLAFGCGSDKKEGAKAQVEIPSSEGNIQSTIQSVATDGIRAVVTFTLFDEKGVALSPTAAGMSVRFTLAQIGADNNYKNYIKATTAGQPGYDSGGTFATIGNGVYTYTFATDIKDTAQTLGNLAFDGGLTHTVGAQITRTVTSVVGTGFQQAVNPYLNFRPDGAAVTETREIVSISSCNGCHGKLGIHGGGRRDVALCILCHYPGPVDPQTNQLIDMKSLIHKIHMGEKLPSNEAGGDYTIIGFGSSVHSYKTVAYPFMSGDSTIAETPIECIKCHVAGKDLMGRDFGRDADKWKESPTREKCTTCHDVTTFDGSTTIVVKNGTNNVTVTAVPHSGGTQADDTGCAGCHPSTAGEYDNSVPGAHTIIEQSSVFTGINFQILTVANATAGNAPTVTFKTTDNTGNSISPASPSSFSLKLGYFSQTDYVNNSMADYGQPLTQSLTGATDNLDGTYTITFSTPIPAGATGIGVIGLEGRRPYANPRTVSNNNIGGKAVQYYFDLATGAQVTDPAMQRRRSVDIDKCNVCHNRVSLHGANRVNSIEECVICHNPNATDKGRRTAPPYADGLTERTIDFKVMIHSIHTGEHLDISKPYIIIGFGGSVNDFSEVRYPRDRRDCLACHIETTAPTFGLPLPSGVLGTSTATGALTAQDSDNTRTRPIKAVCISCHDTTIASNHADGRVVSGSETCTQCHTTGLLLGPDYAHFPVR